MNLEVSYTMKQALTVAQLREELEHLDGDAKVVFVCDYGDHCHTNQALPVLGVETTDTGRLAPSGYSQSGIELTDLDDDADEMDETDPDVRPLVVLRMEPT